MCIRDSHIESSLWKIKIIPISIVYMVYFTSQNKNNAEWNQPYGSFILLYRINTVPIEIYHMVAFILICYLKMILIKIIHVIHFALQNKNDPIWNKQSGLLCFAFQNGKMPLIVLSRSAEQNRCQMKRSIRFTMFCFQNKFVFL